MLQYNTIIKRLARMKASSELSGGYGSIGSEIAMVAMIYSKKPETVACHVNQVYPQVYRKLATGANLV